MSKSFKKLVAIVSAIAMVIAGITVQPQTANAAEALEWSELTDGLGKATIKNTSTEEVRGAEYKGFETDRSWGGDSKWQGQAKVNDVTVEAGQAYKVSLDVSSTPAKKILVQTLSGGEYVEKEYDTTVGHIEQTFAANNDKVNIVVAFGSFSDDEVGKYDVSISNFKLEKTEKSEEQIEKERVEALLTGDENIAKGKTAFSNSVKEKDYQPEEAFDGNLGSRYAATSYESGVTLGVDLGKTYKVSSVAFKWENAYATEYNIQVSKDGKAYDTVKTMTADKAETIEVPLDEAVEARYVRIECVKNALNYGYSLWEMGVYGTEVAEVETTTNTPVVEPGTGETTTPAKQDETTTPAKQDETTVPTAAEKDWSAEDFISSADATYNDTYKAIKDGAINEIVNIQKADDTLGLYVSFADADFGTITVNGKAADIKVAGAGIWFKLSNFTDMYSDVVITNGAGTVKATLYVYNKNGVDNSKKDDETTTPAKPTVAPTTVAPTTVAPTTVAPTTVAPTTVAPTTVAPTTVAPTAKPTETPTARPTETPTAKPTVAPTAKPTVAPTTAKPTTKPKETTKIDFTTDSSIEKPFGLDVSQASVGYVNVVWGRGTIDCYNVYVDGERRRTGISAQALKLPVYTEGTHTIAITTVVGKRESERLEAQIQITGTGEKETEPETCPEELKPQLKKNVPLKDDRIAIELNNKTNGKYSDSEIYWCILGNNANNQLCYMDKDGNMIPASESLNTVEVNGTKYANIYHTLAESDHVYAPTIRSGRMYLSYGKPVYVKFNGSTGYAGPDLNNPGDVNANTLFEFAEFTIEGKHYWGNTTRVDYFCFPMVTRLIGGSLYGGYDNVVGDVGTRDEIFNAFKNEVPNEYKSLVRDDRIIAPCKSTFNVGKINGNYFDNYINEFWNKYANEDLRFSSESGRFVGRVVGNQMRFTREGDSTVYYVDKPNTQEVLEGKGAFDRGNGVEKAIEAQLCAAFNRGVATEPENWYTPSKYYKNSVSNFYAGFFHEHSVLGKAYGFCYDDVNDQSTLLQYDKADALVIDLKW